MSPNEAIVAIVALLGVLGAPVGAMYLWLHRPAARKEVPSRSGESALEARLERIELAVQAIALETERIAEGQRFTTKLLTSPEGSRDSRNVVPRV
ncbi:MAG: hypothetical protein M3Z30_06120 [Gemmatimonadota bacterium]|nr:hypothetical protein [Gemmatimonadota bacterium]